MTLNWGFVVGWVAVAESINLQVTTILMVGAIWYEARVHDCSRESTDVSDCSYSVVYDTIYACQDRKDDVKAGVKSGAVFFGSWVRPILMALSVTFITCLAWAGYMNNQGILLLPVMVYQCYTIIDFLLIRSTILHCICRLHLRILRMVVLHLERRR